MLQVLCLLHKMLSFTINNFIQKARRATKPSDLVAMVSFSVINDYRTLRLSALGKCFIDDYELTIKLMLKELSIAYIDEAFMAQEALRDVKRFIRQRSRWVQGNLDCQRIYPG